MPPLRRALTALAASVLLLGLVTGCSQEDDAPGAGGDTPQLDVPASAAHNEADARFSTAMIPHHAQALSMVDLTLGRKGLSPELVSLAEQIRAAQAPEIELMKGWLQDWDLPVPPTERDHVHGGGHGSSGAPMDEPAMDGMMTAEQMEELEQAPDATFEDRWLEMMIEHHEGALGMAEKEVADGEYADAVDLAQRILDSQRAEIDRMEQMLGN